MEERKKRGRLGSGYNLQPDPSLSRFFTSNFAQFTDWTPGTGYPYYSSRATKYWHLKVASLRGMQPFVCDLDGKLDKPLEDPPLLFSGSAAFIFIKYLQKIKSYRGWARNGSLGTSANMTWGFQILRFPLSAFSLFYSLHNRRTGRDKGGPQAFLYPNFVPDSIYAFASRL